jgi:hypothetical protein
VNPYLPTAVSTAAKQVDDLLAIRRRQPGRRVAIAEAFYDIADALRRTSAAARSAARALACAA